MARQTTLGEPVALSGTGLHTGRPARVVLRPAPEDHGRVLRRVDLDPPMDIPVHPQAVLSSRRCTALGRNGAQVMTVEHLLAALAGLEVDNVLVEVEGPEIPALDNSAAPFVEAIGRAGVVEQSAPRRVRRLRRAVWAGQAAEGRLAVALPSASLTVACAFISDRPALGDQYAEFELTPEVFVREVAPARTVAFLDEVQALREQGLGLGGRAETVVLVGPDGVQGPLRFPDEVVRHKILDLLGDLALAGPLAARVIAIRSGHGLIQELARRIVEQDGG